MYEDKVLKHQKKTLGTLRDLHGLKTTGVIEEDPRRGLLKLAKPVGVIGVLTPVTNASSTLAVNGLPILKTRNAAIFAPHPKAKATAALTCGYMRAGLAQVGAPLDLVQNLAEPSIELSQELMKKVDLVVATGGSAMVKAAYSSGTPSYGVGAGNAVVVVDETADLDDAANKIRLGKIFDNATSCSSENSAVIQPSIFYADGGAVQTAQRLPVQSGREAAAAAGDVARRRASQPRGGRSAGCQDRGVGRHFRPTGDHLPDGAR